MTLDVKWDRLSALLVDVGGTLVDESGWAIRRARYESLMLARLRNAFGREHDWFTNLIPRSTDGRGSR